MCPKIRIKFAIYHLPKEIYFASGRRYGAPKIAKKLQHCGEKVSEKFIGNLMHELGLCSIIRKKYTWHPKKQKIEERENIIDRDFSTKSIWISVKNVDTFS
ncbi:transposase [Lactiplantibacillus plantarum]|nr:transposase [Lactiplantibacillus plantarum]